MSVLKIRMELNIPSFPILYEVMANEDVIGYTFANLASLMSSKHNKNLRFITLPLCTNKHNLLILKSHLIKYLQDDAGNLKIPLIHPLYDLPALTANRIYTITPMTLQSSGDELVYEVSRFTFNQLNSLSGILSIGEVLQRICTLTLGKEYILNHKSAPTVKSNITLNIVDLIDDVKALNLNYKIYTI